MPVGPVTYWNPGTPADYSAVLAYSTGMLGLAVTLWLLRSTQQSLPTNSSGRGRVALTLVWRLPQLLPQQTLWPMLSRMASA